MAATQAANRPSNVTPTTVKLTPSAGSAKKMMKIVMRMGSPRQTSMYRRISHCIGRNRIVSRVPRMTPMIVLPTRAIADTFSVRTSPSSSM